MGEISNKTLAILLIGAIVISLGGTLISLNRLARIRIPGITGFAGTDTATLDVTISDTTQVNWTTSTISWVNGTVVYQKRCELNSYATPDAANCTDFTPNTDGLVLENTGNKNVSLNISTSKDAAGFIGGTAPGYQWNASDLEPGSCIESAGFDAATWYSGSGSTTYKEVCSNFQAGEGIDSMNFDVRVIIADDAVGTKSDTITATATGI